MRPNTLKNVADLIIAEKNKTPIKEQDLEWYLANLRYHASNFKHQIQDTGGYKLFSIIDRPTILNIPLIDTWMAAFAEHIALANDFKVPIWCKEELRFLDRPFMIGGPRARAVALAVAPSSFRRRNLFIVTEFC